MVNVNMYKSKKKLHNLDLELRNINFCFISWDQSWDMCIFLNWGYFTPPPPHFKNVYNLRHYIKTNSNFHVCSTDHFFVGV